MSATTETLVISEVSDQFFVREHLDTKRVELFTELYRVGAVVPKMLAGRIKGDETGKLYKVDGRHRSAALNALGRVKAEFDVKEYGSIAEMVSDALQANSNAPLPPTTEDNIHVVRMLLENGVSRTEVRRRLTFIDRTILRQITDEAERRIAEAKMNKARYAVGNGMSPTDAAEKFGVELPKLRRAISGQKGKDVPRRQVGQLNTNQSNRFKGVNTATVKFLAKVNKLFQDEELTERDVHFLYGNLVRHVDNLMQFIGEGAKRFNALPEVKSLLDVAALSAAGKKGNK